ASPAGIEPALYGLEDPNMSWGLSVRPRKDPKLEQFLAQGVQAPFKFSSRHHSDCPDAPDFEFRLKHRMKGEIELRAPLPPLAASPSSPELSALRRWST